MSFCKFFFILVFFISACAEKQEIRSSLGSIEQKTAESPEKRIVWICNHPGTDFHDDLCVEEEYPAGCYVPGDNGKFCWMLDSEECKNSPDENLRKVCEKIGY
tara:strand:+ start:1351 stop:1659 length:309 start_codon:yes stop_codon:yes gene_type:complete